jgi:peptidoglycan/LPS O-acetylase OafA/YrhL
MSSLLKSCFSQPARVDKHYFFIDLLRGLASITVLFWHYQHFYMLKPNGNPEFASRSVQPLYTVFAPLYTYGLFAVQLFWLISGFVFSAVYLGTRPSARLFFNHRFARLYPLHFMTLVIVAILQWISFRWLGRFQIYPFNDLYHFVLNVLFIPDWGLEKGKSFNDPIWSVSVELAIYVIFFLTIPVLFRRGFVGPTLFVLFFLVGVSTHFLDNFSRCGFFFFIGAIVYTFLRNFPSLSLPVGLLLLVAYIVFFVAWPNFFSVTYLSAFFFSSLVLLCGCLDENLGASTMTRKFSWIGDNTYSVYLIHVPIQITLMTLIDGFGLHRSELASQTWFFLGYIALVLGLGRITFLFIEKPAQRYFRQKS